MADTDRKGDSGDHARVAGLAVTGRPDLPDPTDPGRTAVVEVDASGDRPPAERLAALDQYQVLEELGRGGMGAVFAAYDPNLDRKVAIKVLHRQPFDDPDQATARLRREAQALAKLAHPNVIAVHEVGTLGQDLFVAMEYVDGPSLADWLTEAPRSWSEILAVFVAAGRGLAAAHAVGLVHRDFKPDNVLIGSDGRPRVTDFGLASTAGRALATATPTLSPDTPLSATITVPGAILGTPLYMAPEQFRTGPVDARADQFGFCVALHQALWGSAPFAGDSYAALRDNVVAGRRTPPPRTPRVPRRVRAAVIRGLAVDPDRRFPSLAALLDELAAATRPARHRWWVAAAALVALGVATAWWLTRAPGRDPCRPPADALAGVWDPEVAATLAGRFAATGRPYAADTANRVALRFDNYTTDWLAMHTEACRARRRGQQTAALFDLRMRCLERRRDQLAALTRELTGELEGSVLDSAVTAASSLPPLARCADTATLSAAIPPPDDPGLSATVAALHGRIDRSEVLENLGDYAAALATAAEVAEATADIDYPPLRAEALFRLGKAQGKAGDGALAETTLHQAVRAAAEARDDDLTAWAWFELVYVLGDIERRFDDAFALRPSVEAALARAGDDPPLRARWLHVLGTVLNAHGDFAEAETVLRQAIELYQRSAGPEHIAVAASMTNLGLVLWRQDRIDEALPLFERSLAIMSAKLGPDHPDVARAHNNLSNALSAKGDLDQAEQHLLRAIAIWQGAFGLDHPNIARPIANLGNLYYGQGRLAAAQEQLEKALAILEATRGAEHADLAVVLTNLGSVKADRGDLAAARVDYERALAIREKVFGNDHPAYASTASNLGSILVGLKEYAKAQPYLERALAIDQRVSGPDHPNVAYSLLSLGVAARETGRRKTAIGLLERSLAIRTAHPDPLELAEVEFELAKALWAEPGSRPRARELARSAQAGFASVKETKWLARVDQWLTTHAATTRRP